MVTRKERLGEFTVSGIPPADQPMELLCEDKSGTYALPFACHFLDGSWHNIEQGVPIEGAVVGWRVWK